MKDPVAPPPDMLPKRIADQDDWWQVVVRAFELPKLPNCPWDVDECQRENGNPCEVHRPHG
jgi:hypothetical protein